VLAGVMIGLALSLVWLLYVTTAPKMPLLAREPGTQVFREAGEHPGDESFPGLAVVRLDGGLFFATADALHDRLREIIQDSHTPIHTVVLDFEGVDFIDSQGAAKLAELRQLADNYGINLRLARVKSRVVAILEVDGVVAAIGADHFHGDVDQAVQAQLAGHS
jgi:sulfate permease, SulP family